jgi:outer membrane protein OmpA-like peptidoglycan-associated protein
LQEQDPNKKIMVEGHTDSIGTEENNRKLSQGRADAVREFLVSRGVEASRISAVGKGESEPVADNKSPEGRANNRRVEIIIK